MSTFEAVFGLSPHRPGRMTHHLFPHAWFAGPFAGRQETWVHTVRCERGTVLSCWRSSVMTPAVRCSLAPVASQMGPPGWIPSTFSLGTVFLTQAAPKPTVFKNSDIGEGMSNSAGPGVELPCNFHKEYFRDRLARHVDERAASSRRSGRELSSMFEELGRSSPLCLLSFRRPGQATCVGAAKRRLTVLCGSSVGVRLWPGGARVGVRSAEI